MATLRLCDQCGYKMEPGTPRRTVAGEQKVCESCFRKREGSLVGQQVNLNAFVNDSVTAEQYMAIGRTASLVKHAHDSGDQVTIFHCPFCGSGQVIARSDRTTECTFCHGVFTVQVQPQYSAFPQTIDGQPVEEPGAPGMDGQPDVAPDEELSPEAGGDPNADPNAGGFPPAGGDDQGFPPDVAEGDADGSGDDSGDDDDDDKKPAFLKGSRLYRTASGALLNEQDMVHHIALKLCRTPGDRQRVLALIRAEKGL